ncbi:malonyl-CoA decarboxylase [Leisingera sp. JC11]|uniref:malonyl-CoA decarboxylase n=1 Tax=Leisingera sp. JC11 TaxID=3042469 RepID=UPI003452AFEB
MMVQRSFLSDILRRVAGSKRLGREPQEDADADLIGMCQNLLHDLGEASGLVTAKRILARYADLSADDKAAFFKGICDKFGVDDAALEAAIDAWSPGDVNAARAVHFAAEPRSQELIRHINRVPGATAQLVSMRADLIEIMNGSNELSGLDKDFQHLFSSWFNRGFLEIRRIDWSTPAEILEKIIAYEAVHEIAGWDDLRQRVGDPDRRLFAYFHPAMPSEPLIFVEVALTEDIPGAIAPILSSERDRIEPDQAKTAVFYSISNCQKGLRGISFGNFLIKQVVVELQRELPDLTTFVTLSPVPALRKWAVKAAEAEGPLLSGDDRAAIAALGEDGARTPEFVSRLAARYLTRAKRGKGTVYDPVAHFHLGNGAVLHKVHAEADLSPRGLSNSWGVMVNYLYDGDQIETHHQAYATERSIAASPEVRALAGE